MCWKTEINLNSHRTAYTNRICVCRLSSVDDRHISVLRMIYLHRRLDSLSARSIRGNSIIMCTEKIAVDNQRFAKGVLCTRMLPCSWKTKKCCNDRCGSNTQRSPFHATLCSADNFVAARIPLKMNANERLQSMKEVNERILHLLKFRPCIPFATFE